MVDISLPLVRVCCFLYLILDLYSKCPITSESMKNIVLGETI
jgi:hypothetical protein